MFRNLFSFDTLFDVDFSELKKLNRKLKRKYENKTITKT